MAAEASAAFRDQVLADVYEIRTALESLPDAVHVRVDVDTSGLGRVAAGVTGADAWNQLDDAIHAVRNANYGEAASAEAARAATDAQATSALDDAKAQYMLAMAQRIQGNEARDAAAANADAGTAAAGAAGGLRIFGLTWNTIHWIITGTAEALAVIVPAMVALGSAAAVGLQGAVDAAQRMESVYAATEATYSYLGKTVSTAVGQGLDSFTASAGKAADAGVNLHDALQQAQNAAQPRVYELLGSVIDGATGKFDVFNQIGSQTITMLDRFAAKLDIEMAGPLGNFASQLTSHAVPDLQGLGQVFGNLGHAVATAAADMPGMAEVLLRILDAGTQVLGWALHFRGAMETLLLAHEAQMWGGVLSNALGGVTSALSNGVVALGGWAAKAIPFEAAAAGVEGAALSAGGALERTAAFLGGPWGTVIAGAGIALAFLISDLGRTKSATEQWISSLEGIVSSTTGLQQVGDTVTALKLVTQAYANAQAQAAQATQAYASDAQQATTSGSRFDDTVARTAEHTDNLNNVMQVTKQNAADLSAAQQQLTADWNTEIGNVKLLSAEYKVGYVEAAELAGAAGVSLTQSLKGNSVAAQEARQMITNLIAGYGGMASVGSELGQDINAVSFAAALQSGSVTKLNQSWDSFISTVQAPSSTFLSFAQSLTQFGADAKQAGADISGLGDGAISGSKKMTTASIQLQQDFNSSVTSAEQMLDSLRTVATITGNGGPLVAGIKDVVAAMIPMAGSNQAARAQLFALAQEAGGPASGSMQSLATWAGHTKDPLSALFSLSMNAAGAIQRLGADTQALAATMQSSLNQTLVTQAQNLTGVDQKTATYLQDLQKYGPAAADTQTALANLNNANSQSISLAAQAASGINILSGKTAQEGQAARGAHGARQQLNTDIQDIHNLAPAASQAVSAMTDAIRAHGLASVQYRSARQTLISDLEAAGVQASTATTWVNNLATAVAGLHSKTINVNVATSVTGPGAGIVTGGATGAPGVTHSTAGAASGMLVPGHGTGDTVPALLTPGEAVVPRHLVPALAGFLGAHGVPGFAAGGPVGGGGGGSGGHGGPVGGGGGGGGPGSPGGPVGGGGGRGRHHHHWGGHGPVPGGHRHEHLSPGELILERWTEEILARKYLHSRDWVAIEQLMAHGHILIGHNDRISGGYLKDFMRRARLIAELEGYPTTTGNGPGGPVGGGGGSGNPSGGGGYGNPPGGPVGGGGHGGPPQWWIQEQINNLLGGGQLPVPYGIYDQGGYLPTGWSLAYNGTRRPEPVGGGGVPAVHVHLHGDLADDTLWERMQVNTADYSRRQTGLPTGVWQP